MSGLLLGGAACFEHHFLCCVLCVRFGMQGALSSLKVDFKHKGELGVFLKSMLLGKVIFAGIKISF